MIVMPLTIAAIRCRDLARGCHHISRATASSPLLLAPSLRNALPSLTSIVRGVTNSSWAISRSARHGRARVGADGEHLGADLGQQAVRAAHLGQLVGACERLARVVRAPGEA